MLWQNEQKDAKICMICPHRVELHGYSILCCTISMPCVILINQRFTVLLEIQGWFACKKFY